MMVRPPIKVDWSPMNYRNIDLKVDQFVAYLNEDKINLIPSRLQTTHVSRREERGDVFIRIMNALKQPE